MVTYSCDRCSGVVGGPNGLSTGKYVTPNGLVVVPMTFSLCQQCVSDVVAFADTPIAVRVDEPVAKIELSGTSTGT